MEIRPDFEWRDYGALTTDIYRHYHQYRDSMSPLIKDIVSGQSPFSRHIEKSLAGVYDGGKLLAATVLISSEKLPGYLSMAFFEALDDRTAIMMLLDHAKRSAAARGIGKVIVGINGHMNYGMGLLCDNFDKPVSFWSSFNPPYYYDYLKGHADNEHGLASYVFDLASLGFVKYRSLFARLNKRFKYRVADFKQLEREVEIYTRLINECFEEHPLYWERTKEENGEMYEALRPFLRGEHLIFAEDEGRAVGYVLWHPDLNELITPGKSIGLATLIKYRIGWPRITRFKVAEIGVLPKYRGSGLIFGLLHNCFCLAKDRYSQCESGWIMDENFPSRSLISHFGGTEYKHYKVLEFDVCQRRFKFA
ncbi:MAG: GNAT family N-acetyltransferase [Sporomusaceae bacterium]|nr:GNAT family N-acetyltransferase [Sporomusaceae bacterium]